MPDEPLLREQAREAVRTGKLPSRSSDRLFGVSGNGGPCAVCGKPLTREEMEVQLQFNRHDGTPGLDQYHLHHRCQVGEWTPEQRQLVFPTATGVPVKYIHFLTEIWRPTLKKAGLAARKYHSTRHSYAAWSRSAG